MRLTIVKDDNIVVIDGKPLNVDLSALPENFHALQWYEDYGIIEWKDKAGTPSNERIENLENYQWVIREYNKEKQRLEEEQAAREAAHQAYLNSIDYLRQVRNDMIEEIMWIDERHRTQKDLGIQTTLTDEQYLEYLQYLQALRDITNFYSNINEVVWPQRPAFLPQR